LSDGLQTRDANGVPVCTLCHRAGTNDSPLRVCGGCKAAWYCSTNCQVKHWKRKGHKHLCRRISAMQAKKDLNPPPLIDRSSSPEWTLHWVEFEWILIPMLHKLGIFFMIHKVQRVEYFNPGISIQIPGIFQVYT